MFQLYCCLHKCALSSTVIFESSKQNIYKFFTAALIWMQIPVYFILYVYSLPNIRSPNLSDIFWQLFFFRIPSPLQIVEDEFNNSLTQDNLSDCLSNIQVKAAAVVRE